MNILIPSITTITLLSPGIVLSFLIFSKKSLLFIICVGFCLSLTMVGALSIFLEMIQVELNRETIAISFVSFDTVILLLIIYRIRILSSNRKNKDLRNQSDRKSTRLFFWISAIISLVFIFAIQFIGSSKRDYFTEIYLLRGQEGIAPWEMTHDKSSSIDLDVNVTSHEKESISYLINLESENKILSSVPILFLESNKGSNVKLIIPPSDKPNQLYIIKLTKCPTLDYCIETNQTLSLWIKRGNN
jgi:hypothetical protein